jgi:PAS domain S-box-containing protein
MDPVTLALLLERVLWIGGGITLAGGWVTRNQWSIPFVKRIGRWLCENRPGAKSERIFEEIMHQLIDSEGVGVGSRITELNGRQRHILAMLAVIDIKKKLLEDHVRVATFTTDAGGDCVDVSQRYMRLVGMSMDELRGTGWKLGVAPEDLSRWEEQWTKALVDGRIFIGETEYLNRATGARTPVRVTAYPVKSEGVLVCYVGTVRPIGRVIPEQEKPVDQGEEDRAADLRNEENELLGS